MEILLLCTGNQCRSPMAAGLLRERLHRAGVDATVRSAGLGPDGVVASAPGIEVLRRSGIDIADSRSRRVDEDDVRSAHLVLGMARQHVLEAVSLDPHAMARAFTLKELVERGERIGARRAGETVEQWLERAGEGRRPRSLLGTTFDADLDVADPIGQPADAYERTAAELDGLLSRLVALLWPDRPSVGPLLVAEGVS